MRKFFRNLGIISLICFSFYFTEKTVTVVREADELMIEIKNRQNQYIVKPIEGIIEKDTFIPGVSGKKVNINKSYQKMKQYGSFNEGLLIYDVEKPQAKLIDNLDKYIIGGNETKKQVSIILLINSSNYLDETLEILNDNAINVNFFVDGNWLEDNSDYLTKFISAGHDIGNLSYNLDYQDSSFPWMDNTIKKITNNQNNYCYATTDSKNTLDICSRHQNYTIRPSIILENNYLTKIKTSLKAGSIISIPLSKEVIKILPTLNNYIKSKGLDVVTLKELISED